MGSLDDDPINREFTPSKKRSRPEEQQVDADGVVSASAAEESEPEKFDYVVYGKDFTTGKMTRMRLRSPDGFGVIAWCYKRRVKPVKFSRLA